MDVESVQLIRELYDEITYRAPRFSKKISSHLSGLRGTYMQIAFIRRVAEENWSVFKGAFNEVVLRYEVDDSSPYNFFNILEHYQITVSPYGEQLGGRCNGR